MNIRQQISQLQQLPQIVKLLVVGSFLEGFVPILALYALMFERSGGLSFEQVGYLFSIWSIAFLLAELPSGILADYWSRRKVIIIGGLLRAAGFLLWLLWPTFIGFAVGFALWGVAIACTSGTVSAYLQNEVKAIGKPGKYAKYYGWLMSMHWLGTFIAYTVASVLTLKHSDILIILSIISSLLSAAVLLFQTEHSYKKQSSYLKTLRAGFEEVLGSKQLRYVCYALFSVYMVIGVLEELLPIIYASFGYSDTVVALLLAAGIILTVVLLTRLESMVRFSLAKQVLLMAVGLSFFIVGLQLGGVSGVVLVLIFNLIFQLFRPLFMHHVQEAAIGDEKATIASIPGLAAGVFTVFAYMLIGMGSKQTSELSSMTAYGCLWLILLVLLAIAGRRYHLKRDARHPISGPEQPIAQP